MADRMLGRTMRAQLGRIRESTTRWQVYAQLRSDIVSLDLAPGQAVSEAELAEVYGVSRTPVREALIRLAEDHLVEVVPQAGTYVTRISVREVTDVHFIRETMELATLPHIAERMTEEDEAQLRDLLAKQRWATERGDVAAWFASDEELHFTLQQVGDHMRTWSVISWAKAHLDRVRMLARPDGAQLATLHARHTALIDNLAAKRLKPAEQVLTEHLREVLGLLEPLREAHSGYFVVDEAPAGPAYSRVSSASASGRRRTGSGHSSGTPKAPVKRR